MLVQSEIDWRTLQYDDLLDLIKTEEQALKFAIIHGLIKATSTCDCGSTMHLQAKQDRATGFIWACSRPRQVCCRTKSILTGTWFAHSRLSLRAGIKAIAAYASGLTFEQFPFFVGVRSKATVSDWRNYFRELCQAEIDREGNDVIGGVGLTVEIDETHIFTRKHNVGRLSQNERRQCWVLGGICRETGAAFVEWVASRDRQTLFEVIVRRVAAGTRIITDGARVYRTLQDEGYSWQFVNHRHNFVSPDDPDVHTQRIERSWRTLKEIIPANCRDDLKWSYLAEYTWKQRIR